MPVCRYAYNVR